MTDSSIPSAPAPAGIDPELNAWSDEAVQDAAFELDEDRGPTLCWYDVSFMHPWSYTVEAFTVTEAINKAIVLLAQDCGVHNPQVEAVRMKGAVGCRCGECGQELPRKKRTVASVAGGKITARQTTPAE